MVFLSVILDILWYFRIIIFLPHYGLFTPIPSPPPIFTSASSLALMRYLLEEISVYKDFYIVIFIRLK